MTLLLAPPVAMMAHGSARFTWWDGWLEHKQRFVRDAVPQLDASLFRALCAGTGLPPIHQRSNFPFRSAREGARRFSGRSLGRERPFARIYTRLGNPTTEYLERVLLDLEAHHAAERARAAGESDSGLAALVFASGMGAITTLLMALLRQGDAVLLGNVYGSTDSFVRGMARYGVRGVFCDTSDLGAVEAALEANRDVAAVFLESPENPTLKVADIHRISWLTEARGIPLIVDNTFCSPYLQQPFRLGADFVVHSLTKFVNGHSASVGGAVLGPAGFVLEEMFGWYKDLGPSPSPFESWLNGLCLQDLAVRQDAQSETAAALAAFLRAHPRVAHVFYPGLPDFPQAELARAQMRNGGSMVSFELKDGLAAGEALMNYFAREDTPMELAVSLGAAISYIEHPASMTHAVVPEADRRARGITPGLVRLSVGLEGLSVLQEHLARGLDWR